jgi:hypothetical protein
MEKMGLSGLSETYMYSWLQNLAGMTGAFVNYQKINVDYWSEEQEKNTTNHQEANKNGN